MEGHDGATVIFAAAFTVVSSPTVPIDEVFLKRTLYLSEAAFALSSIVLGAEATERPICTWCCTPTGGNFDSKDIQCRKIWPLWLILSRVSQWDYVLSNATAATCSIVLNAMAIGKSLFTRFAGCWSGNLKRKTCDGGGSGVSGSRWLILS